MQEKATRCLISRASIVIQMGREGIEMSCDFVLVVDDDEELRSTIEEVLELDGHRVVGVANGEQALGVLALARPQLVVTDLSMPLRDGASLIADMQAHERTSHVPVCVLSGEIDKAPPGVPTLKKPVEVAELCRTVDSILASHGGQSALAA
jgi:CheY-like chemotaxis protein